MLCLGCDRSVVLTGVQWQMICRSQAVLLLGVVDILVLFYLCHPLREVLDPEESFAEVELVVGGEDALVLVILLGGGAVVHQQLLRVLNIGPLFLDVIQVNGMQLNMMHFKVMQLKVMQLNMT